MEFCVLGPLEVRLGGETLPLGGAKQRAVLAVLLLRADEVVPLERLVDEVWGDEPPPSAAHTLESYVSRLRQLFNGHGPTLARRGAGYSLELQDASLDARTFLALQEDASLADAAAEHERAFELATAALACWRGPALADVVLAPAGRAEAERLEELRLRTYEVRFDAELALGRHEHVVGELQSLVGQNPYRERFVAQLMLALYRSGRHADALDVYERTRAALSEDLGLQPSAELQQLSGQIVRQDSQLQRPAAAAVSQPRRPHPIRRRTRRFAELVAVGAIVASTMALTASGSPEHATSATPADPNATRVALVLPREPEGAFDDPRVRDTTSAFREYTHTWGHEAEILVANEIDPSPDDVERTAHEREAGGFALVLVLGNGATARALAPTVRRLTETRFAFVDASLATLSLDGVPNATGMPYADYESGELVGYLSGLVAPRGGRPEDRADEVSVVAAPRTPRVQRVVRAFARGVRRALPHVAVRVNYARNPEDKTACERLANDQIDSGSDVVFATAGDCSSAVLAVVRTRGVWGINVNDDGVAEGPHLLATSRKWWLSAVTAALNGYELDTLPHGRDVVLGLDYDYAVSVEPVNWRVPDAAVSKMVELCSRIREHSRDNAS